MDDADISRTSFHALGVLVAVHETGSVSAAAGRFGMNQSSVSYVIDRLRQVFGDPLFVRTGRGMTPTLRCSEVVATARRLVEEFGMLAEGASFDPARSEARFTLSCNFHERTLVVPGLLRAIRHEAPGVRVEVVQAGTEPYRQLALGHSDLALTPIDPGAHKVRSERLFTERYACFVDAAGPLARRRLTLQDYARASHIQVNYAEGWRPFFHDHIAHLGVTVTPAVEVPSFGAIDRIVAGTDLVLTAPSGLSRVLEPALARISAPFDVAFDEHMAWTERTDRSPAHVWLRERVRDSVRAAGLG